MSFGGLNISVSGLLASQAGLDVTSNNIANTNTVGYSRKTLTFSEGVITGFRTKQILSGVVVDQITRVRDEFLDQQIRQQASNAGRDKTIADLAVAMNDILGEPSDSGITAKLNSFFQAASDLATNPDSSAAKAVFINSASALAESFNQVDQSIGLLQQNLNDKPIGKIPTAINELNQKLARLSDIHSQILAAGGKDQDTSNLKDSRDLLLNDISNLIDVNLVRFSDGNLSKLTLNVNASSAQTTGSINFPNFDSSISGINSSNNTLTLTVNNGNGTSTGPFTVNFESGSTIRDVVNKINKSFNATGGLGQIASLDESGKLVLQTASVNGAANNSSAAITIDSGSTALAVLGLTAGTTSGSDSDTITLLDGKGLHYTFDSISGSTDIGINPSKLILKTNDPLETTIGSIDSFKGVLGGLFQMINKDIPELKKELSDFAMSIKKSVNDILALGKTANGNAGAALFTGNSATDFAVNSNVINNNSLLTQGKTGAVSDGSIAASVAELFFGTNNIISNGANSEKVYIDSPSSSYVTSSLPLIPGKVITINADGLIDDNGSSVNAGTNGFGGGSLVQIEFIDASGATIGSAIDFPTNAGAPTTRVSYTGTIPNGAAFVRFKMNSSSFNDNNISNNSGHFGLSIVQGVENSSSNNLNNKVANIVGSFGSKGNAAIAKSENSTNLHDSLANRRDSISGVSIEEEAANLIKFQNSFSANARVLSIWNQIFDDIIRMI